MSREAAARLFGLFLVGHQGDDVQVAGRAGQGDAQFIGFVFDLIEFLQHVIDFIHFHATESQGHQFVEFLDDAQRVFTCVNATRSKSD